LASGVLALFGLTLWGTALPARALMVAPAPIPERVALADSVIVGTVGAAEAKTVEAIPFPGGKEKVGFTVFPVKVESSLTGLKDIKEIRVGYVAAMAGGPVRPRPQVRLAPEQQGLFFLTKHAEESFYVPQMYFDFVDKKNPGYDKELALVQRCAKLLAGPTAGLKSKDPEDRLLTAGMLISRYRTPKGPNPKTEAVDAEQSKLILQALADADWTKVNDPLLRGGAQNYFLRLGLTVNDGWTPPKTAQEFKELPSRAKAWIKDNAGTYRMQRFVSEPAGK
jgi:hypothetical protein